MNSQALIRRRVSHGSSEGTQSVWHAGNAMLAAVSSGEGNLVCLPPYSPEFNDMSQEVPDATAGESWIEVNRFFPSSKTCHVCLNQVSSLSLEVRNWRCEVCTTEHDRDVNAAINIRNEALRISELGTRSTAFGRERKSSGKTSVLLDAVPVEQGSRLSIA
jgi:hypothetical protein